MSEGTSKAELDLWYPRADILAIRLEGPDGIAVGPVRPDEHGDIVHDGQVTGRLYSRQDDPNNGDNEVSLFLYEGAPAGDWRLVLDGIVVGDGRVHAWVERNPAGA